MLLVGRQEGYPACKKTEWWGAGMVICLEQGADLHMAQLMPLPLTVSCFSKIQIGFTFLVPARLGSHGKGLLNGCVCVCVGHIAAQLCCRVSVCLGVLSVGLNSDPYKNCWTDRDVSVHLSGTKEPHITYWLGCTQVKGHLGGFLAHQKTL